MECKSLPGAKKTYSKLWDQSSESSSSYSVSGQWPWNTSEMEGQHFGFDELIDLPTHFFSLLAMHAHAYVAAIINSIL